jgi:Cu2+-exporting ATPase
MTSARLENPCYHCQLPVPTGTEIYVRIEGKDRAMCCHGCQAVAEAIVKGGMADFYRYRTASPTRQEELVPAFLDQLKVYDKAIVQQHFIEHPGGDGHNDPADSDILEVALILEGIVCAACIWLNERQLNALPGVIEASINYSTHRARVRWDNHRIQLSQILEAISRIGYQANPYDRDRQQRLIEKERKQQLRRIGLAGVIGMQIMILAVAMYTGEWWGIDENFLQLFRWSSLMICVPLLLFASRTFFESAWRDLRNRRVGMDVPVALGIGIAFAASTLHTIKGTGAVYFDSVAMFTFFLLGARYFEMSARKRTAEASEALLQLQPAIATRLVNENGIEQQHSVAVAELEVDDRILVRPGENIATDGIIIEGSSGINESLLTGESLPALRSVGDKVIGGSTNTESPLIIRVEKIGDDTVLASIQRLLEQAQTHKPAIAQLTDRIAARFVSVILFIAAIVALYWWQVGNADWLQITIATLVVTCPCALSLATPTAITAASGSLSRIGLLTNTGKALETLARTTHFVFDKTGTLTTGKMQLIKTLALGDKTEQDYLHIAAALEAGSEHPIARGLIQSAGERTVHASELHNTAGGGVSGKIDNALWHLGSLQHIQDVCAASVDAELLAQHQISVLNLVALASEHKVHALFALDDSLRPEAAELVKQLRAAGKQLYLFSGDHTAVAQRIAGELGIENVQANLTPADKLAAVRELQQQGAIVAMIGDGINDAPVLAGADVSIAMGSGTQLAAASADMILLSNNILHLATAYHIAQSTLTIIKQNLLWAVGYNLIAVPAAAMGYVQPWLAAVGMSASSLIVVLNALRLTRIKPAKDVIKND